MTHAKCLRDAGKHTNYFTCIISFYPPHYTEKDIITKSTSQLTKPRLRGAEGLLQHLRAPFRPTRVLLGCQFLGRRGPDITDPTFPVMSSARHVTGACNMSVIGVQGLPWTCHSVYRLILSSSY